MKVCLKRCMFTFRVNYSPASFGELNIILVFIFKIWPVPWYSDDSAHIQVLVFKFLKKTVSHKWSLLNLEPFFELLLFCLANSTWTLTYLNEFNRWPMSQFSSKTRYKLVSSSIRDLVAFSAVSCFSIKAK